MGKHFWAKHVDDATHDKQPGCMWGLVHALDYHHWHSNVRKMILYHKHENISPSTYDWSPESKIHSNDPNEVEKLLVDESAKRSRGTKKRSLRARIKALVAEEISNSKGSVNTKPKRPFSSRPKFERTYSIHHLESLDAELGEVPTDWNRPIIFLPKDLDNRTKSDETDFKTDSDVLDIFKVDKELLIKHLEDGDEGVANFTRSALGLNTKSKFSKSRSFPVEELSQGVKLKPIKLESKHKEVWSLPKEDKFQTIHQRLFEKSFRMDTKLHPSKSLKLANDCGQGPICFRRIQSLSNVDSYYSKFNFDVSGEDTFGNGSFVTANDSGSCLHNCKEKEEIEIILRDNENGKEPIHSEIAREELRSNEGLEQKSCDLGELWSLAGSDDRNYSNSFNLENDKIFEKIVKCCPENDLYYVRHVLDQSGIAVDASERTWHAIDQPLGPQLFEDVEAWWPHNQDQSDGCHEFYGCWHHQMLFELINEVLLEVYDRSLPYYPKALSSRCYVRTFLTGNYIIDDVTTSIGRLMNMSVEEKQSLDCIVGRDLSNDDSWMNLQFESECSGFEIEDMIFDELLQEIVCS